MTLSDRQNRVLANHGALFEDAARCDLQGVGIADWAGFEADWTRYLRRDDIREDLFVITGHHNTDWRGLVCPCGAEIGNSTHGFRVHSQLTGCDGSV